MIRAVLYRDGAARLVGFSIRGHSGYAEEGSDIVCAAVSVLAITCINSLESVCGVTPQVEGGTDGYLKAMLPATISPQADHDAQLLLQSLQVGLRDLMDSYAPYVTLSIQERRETP